jgi:rRNA-processing protein FCF1
MASNRIRRNTENGRIIIIDTNALIMLFEFSINFEEQLTRLFGKYKIIVPRAVVKELKTLKQKGKGSKKYNAKASLDLINKTDMKIIETETKGDVDDIVYNLAKETKYPVLTNDKELRKRLKNIPVNVVFLRSKNYFAIE